MVDSSAKIRIEDRETKSPHPNFLFSFSLSFYLLRILGNLYIGLLLKTLEIQLILLGLGALISVFGTLLMIICFNVVTE